MIYMHNIHNMLTIAGTDGCGPEIATWHLLPLTRRSAPVRRSIERLRVWSDAQSHCTGWWLRLSEETRLLGDKRSRKKTKRIVFKSALACYAMYLQPSAPGTRLLCRIVK
jgi:hypothetical protein